MGIWRRVDKAIFSSVCPARLWLVGGPVQGQGNNPWHVQNERGAGVIRYQIRRRRRRTSAVKTSNCHAATAATTAEGYATLYRQGPEAAASTSLRRRTRRLSSPSTAHTHTRILRGRMTNGNRPKGSARPRASQCYLCHPSAETATQRRTRGGEISLSIGPLLFLALLTRLARGHACLALQELVRDDLRSDQEANMLICCPWDRRPPETANQ